MSTRHTRDNEKILSSDRSKRRGVGGGGPPQPNRPLHLGAVPYQATQAEQEEEALMGPAPRSRTMVDNVTPLISTVLTSLFAVQVLYSVSSQRELWIVVVGSLLLGMKQAQSLVAKKLYTKLERDDVDQAVVMQFFRFINTTLMFIVSRLLYDAIVLLIYTSVLYWYNYIDVLLLVMIFAFIIFSQFYT